MGLYDRDYYREEPRGFRFGGDRSMVVNLIIINAVIYVVDWLLTGGELGRRLALKPDLFEEPWQAWQLLTYGFLHDQTPTHVIFNMITLWFFGREVEGAYGKSEFLKLYLSLIVLAGLVWVVVEQLTGGGVAPVVGASGAVVGVLIVFVCKWPHQTVHVWFIPMPAWVLGLIFVVSDMLRIMNEARDGSGSRVAFAAHLGGALFGFIYYQTGWHLGRLVPTQWVFVPTQWVSQLFTKRPKLRVHRPERERTPDEDELSRKADAVLEKISLYGQSSLTPEECRILEAYSRRMQQKLR